MIVYAVTSSVNVWTLHPEINRSNSGHNFVRTLFVQNVSVKKQCGQLKCWLLHQSKVAVLNMRSNPTGLSVHCRDHCRMITPVCWFVGTCQKVNSNFSGGDSTLNTHTSRGYGHWCGFPTARCSVTIVYQSCSLECWNKMSPNPINHTLTNCKCVYIVQSTGAREPKISFICIYPL